MCLVIYTKTKSDQDPIEVSLHTHEDGYNQKGRYQEGNVGENVEKLEIWQ